MQADKVRLEQLALRQSKQLVPVVAGPKAKHSPTLPGPATSASMLTALKKPSGMAPAPPRGGFRCSTEDDS